jgi:hypothetical protein
MGATWEHPAHLYLKRATLDRQLLGDPQEHRERLAQLVGLGSVTMTDTDVTPTLPAGL